MDPKRWKQVDTLLQSALERAPADRAAFLREACAGDDALECEVQSMLGAHDEAGSFLDAPAMHVAAQSLAERIELHETLVGRSFSHYQISGVLGRGGMGVVYRAQDARLERPVALKVLSGEFARQADALDRFRREARAASALNHPNICTLYDFGEQDGRAFIAMECLDGETLKDRLARGSIPRDEALTFAVQIAAALEAAHRAGVIHRDIKPANIFLARSGVKILDFGLAQLHGDSEQLTNPGFAVGTLGYMAPEQEKGLPLDARADLYSFGLVLCEMLKGIRGADRITRKAIEREPARRFNSAAQMKTELEGLRRRTLPKWAAAGLVLAALFGIGGYFYLQRPAKLTDRDTVVLADFRNATGDAVFDGTLSRGLAVELGQSPFLQIVADDRIETTLGLMGRPAGAQLTPEIARDVCERVGGAAAIDGSIRTLGTGYVVGLRAVGCRNGRVLAEEQAQVPRKEDVLNSVSQVARRLRSRLGESLVTVEKHSTPLAEATTPSLEALKAFTAASARHTTNTTAADLMSMKRATEIDPNFAWAHAFLSHMYGENGESDLSALEARKAYDLRNRTSAAEKFFIQASYDLRFTGNMQRAQQTCDLWAQTYPRDSEPHSFLSGMVYVVTGKYDKAVQEAEIALQLRPDDAFSFANLAWSYTYLNQYDQAAKVLHRASELKLKVPDMNILSYDLAFLRRDEAAMNSQVAAARSRPDSENWIFDRMSFVAAYRGQIQEARGLATSAVNLALQTGERERAALYQTGAAVWEALYGNVAEARNFATEALRLSRDREVEYGAAYAKLLCGDVAGARVLAANLETRFPEDTSVRFSYLPVLKATMALRRGDAAGAVDEIRVAEAYELSSPRSAIHGFFGSMYPVYVRGLARLRLGQPVQAAAEFRKIVVHDGIVASDPMGALARLHLARALASSGDREGSVKAYAELLQIWKNADAGMAIVAAARAEAAIPAPGHNHTK